MTFLGDKGSRRYLVAAMNNAEMRDQGMALGYAVLETDNGQIRFVKSGSTGVDLGLTEPITNPPVPPGMQEVFGGLAPNLIWQSVNATADFAWSGAAMAAMFEQATSQRVDGVISIDVPGLASLLDVVGPIDVADIDETISGENVGRILLNDLYVGAPVGDQTARKERLGDVAAAVGLRLASGEHDGVALADRLGMAAAGGHLKLWSGDAAEEATLERVGLGGGPGLVKPNRTFHVAVQNGTASKLDYFVNVATRMNVVITPGGSAVVRTEVDITNTAPDNAPRSYQFGTDPKVAPAHYLARVYLWGPAGSTQIGSIEESALQLSQDPALVRPGETVTLHFESVIPDALVGGRFEMRVVPQPRLRPVATRVGIVAPGRTITGPATIEFDGTRTSTVNWQVSG